MENETKIWIDDAIRKCAEAQKNNVTLLLRRDQPTEDEDGNTVTTEPVVACTSSDPKAILALGQVMDAFYFNDEEDDE